MSYDYTARREANDQSRTTAEAHGEIWEAHEVELLEEGWGESTLPEIAELLGRTIEACRQKHWELQRQPIVRAVEGRRKAHHNSKWDKGWTSLEDMGF